MSSDPSPVEPTVCCVATRRRGLRGWSLAALVLPCLAVQPAQGGIAQSAGKVLEEVFQDVGVDGTPGCVCGVVSQGRLAISRGFGMVALDSKKTLQSDTPFYVGSLAKQFTAAMALLLAERGQFDLHADFRTYVPELPDYGARLTPWHLLTHTSGVRDYLSLMRMRGASADSSTVADVYKLIFRQSMLNFPVGERASYSNSGYALIALALERQMGRPLGPAIRSEIFSPLGMDHSVFISARNQLKGTARGYRKTSAGEFEPYEPSLFVPGVGALVTTVTDLARWIGALERSALTANLTDRLTTPARAADGTLALEAPGLQIRQRFGWRVVEHGGSNRGYSAHLAWAPDAHLGVVTLCNVRQANAPRRNLEVLSSLVDLPDQRRSSTRELEGAVAQAKPVTVEDLSAWAGVYEVANEGEALELEIQSGVMVATLYGAHPDGGTAGSHRVVRDEGTGVLTLEGVSDPTELRFVGDPTTGGIAIRSDALGERSYRPVNDGSRLRATDLVGTYWSDELEAQFEIQASAERLVLSAIPNGGTATELGTLVVLSSDLVVLREDLLVNIHVTEFSRGTAIALELSEPRARGVRLIREVEPSTTEP